MPKGLAWGARAEAWRGPVLGSLRLHHSLVPLIPQIPHSAYRDSSQTGQGFDAISSQRSAGSGVAQGIRGGTSVNRSLHSSRLLYTTKLQY
jgi:hypothetical protein